MRSDLSETLSYIPMYGNMRCPRMALVVYGTNRKITIKASHRATGAAFFANTTPIVMHHSMSSKIRSLSYAHSLDCKIPRPQSYRVLMRLFRQKWYAWPQRILAQAWKTSSGLNRRSSLFWEALGVYLAELSTLKQCSLGHPI